MPTSISEAEAAFVLGSQPMLQVHNTHDEFMGALIESARTDWDEAAFCTFGIYDIGATSKLLGILNQKAEAGKTVRICVGTTKFTPCWRSSGGFVLSVPFEDKDEVMAYVRALNGPTLKWQPRNKRWLLSGVEALPESLRGYLVDIQDDLSECCPECSSKYDYVTKKIAETQYKYDHIHWGFLKECHMKAYGFRRGDAYRVITGGRNLTNSSWTDLSWQITEPGMTKKVWDHVIETFSTACSSPLKTRDNPADYPRPKLPPPPRLKSLPEDDDIPF